MKNLLLLFLSCFTAVAAVSRSGQIVFNQNTTQVGTNDLLFNRTNKTLTVNGAGLFESVSTGRGSNNAGALELHPTNSTGAVVFTVPNNLSTSNVFVFSSSGWTAGQGWTAHSVIGEVVTLTNALADGVALQSSKTNIVYLSDAGGLTNADNTIVVSNILRGFQESGIGGHLIADGGIYPMNRPILIPNDGGTPATQVAIRISGVAMNAESTVSDHAGHSGGGFIFTLTNQLACIQTSGRGGLELDHLSIFIVTTNVGYWFYSTLSMDFIHHNSVIGPVAGTNAVKIARFGGQANIVVNGTTNDPFQGYGTIIEKNHFNKMSSITLGAAANNVWIAYNNWWNNCGGDAPVRIFGSISNSSARNIIGPNLWEVPYFRYGLILSNASDNRFIHNGMFDEGDPVITTMLAGVLVLSNCVGNVYESDQPGTYPPMVGLTNGNAVVTYGNGQKTIIPNTWQFESPPIVHSEQGIAHQGDSTGTSTNKVWGYWLDSNSYAWYWEPGGAGNKQLLTYDRISATDYRMSFEGRFGIGDSVPMNAQFNIQTTSGGDFIHVVSTAGQRMIWGYNSGDNPVILLKDGTSGATLAQIAPAGNTYFPNIGVNTNNPVAKLEVNGGATFNGVFRLSDLSGSGNNVHVDSVGIFSRTNITSPEVNQFVQSITVTNELAFNLATNSPSEVTNYVVNFNQPYSKIFAGAAGNDLNFIHSTNRTEGLWKFAVFKIYSGVTNRRIWFNTNWGAIGGSTTNKFLLASNRVAILSLGQDGLYETNVVAVVATNAVAAGQ